MTTNFGRKSLQSRWVLGLTFPNHKDAPAQSAQFFGGDSIAFDVSLKFLRPECAARFRACRPWAVLVLVPKATVNENNGVVRR